MARQAGEIAAGLAGYDVRAGEIYPTPPDLI